MICPNCNREIDDDSRFCRHCGVEFIDEKETVIKVDQFDEKSDADENPIIAPYEEIAPIKNAKNKKRDRIKDEADKKDQERRESMGKWK